VKRVREDEAVENTVETSVKIEADKAVLKIYSKQWQVL